MLAFPRKIAALAAALSLCASTSAIAASAPAIPTTPAATSAPASPWLTLSAMSGSAAAATAATAAAQGDVEDEAGMGWPPLPVLAVILATIGVAIFFLVDDEDSSFGATAISPG